MDAVNHRIGLLRGRKSVVFFSDGFRMNSTVSAARTGGLYFANRNDIPECVRQAADDQLGY